MFNIGDLVRGNSTHYGITNDNSLNIVVKNLNPSNMWVIILEGDNDRIDLPHELNLNKVEEVTSNFMIRNCYNVDPCHFKPITLEEWEELKASTSVRFYRNFHYDEIINYFTKERNTTMTTSILNLNKGQYNFTEEQKEYALNNLENLMSRYHHDSTDKGLNTIWEEYKVSKAGLAYLLSMHPNWDEKVMGIVLQNDYHRVSDTKAIANFINWCQKQITKWAYKREYKVGRCSCDELYQSKGRLERVIELMKKLRQGDDWWDDSAVHHSVKYDGMSYEEVVEEYERVSELYHILIDDSYSNGWTGVRLSYEDNTKVDNFISFLNLIKNSESNVADESFAEKANKIAEPFNYVNNKGKVVGLRATAGQKISKIVNKFMKYYEFDTIKDLRSESYIVNDELHVRERDYGWNKQFADFANGINPLDVKKWTIISVNPVDYLTMSFGRSWASCHTIDKQNERRSKGNYEGCYCSGTLSYMLDDCTLIMYTVSEDYKGKDFCLQDKENRCNFHIGEDKFIQGRLYPDGREADKETSLAGQFRAIMQTVLSECIKEANLWKVLKGTDNCYEVAYATSGSTNYPDWEHYNDCNVSYLKRNGLELNKIRIKIGHKPICPSCGKMHTTTEWLNCYDCRHENIERCSHCGEDINIDRDDFVYDEDTGNYYCDSECAELDDVYYCENVDEYHSEYVYQDSYTGECFYDYCEEEYIHINGDFHYLDIENANNDGWLLLDDEWYTEDDSNVIECPHCGCYTLADHDECLECGAIINEDEYEDVV